MSRSKWIQESTNLHVFFVLLLKCTFMRESAVRIFCCRIFHYNIFLFDQFHHVFYPAIARHEHKSKFDGTEMPEFEKRIFNKKRYNHESKRNKVNKALKRRKRGTNSANIRAIEDAMSTTSLKTANFEAVLAGLHLRLRVYDVLRAFYNNTQYQKLKVEARIAAQKTDDRLLDFISHDRTKVIGFGDGSKMTGFRGLSPGGPMKKLKRMAVKKGYSITMVNEAYTSKRASCCRGEDLRPMKRPTRDQDGVMRVKDVHGLRTCPKCKRTWNRDFTAAINIWDIFYSQTILGKERPWHLNRTPVIPGAPDQYFLKRRTIDAV